MNAKQEFLEITKDTEVLCVTINVKGDYSPLYLHKSKKVKSKELALPVGYTQEEYNNFLNELDFEYDESWGHQFIYGTIWLKDGMWIERGEYDGSEWWKLVQAPNIPKECFPKENKVDYNFEIS